MSTRYHGSDQEPSSPVGYSNPGSWSLGGYETSRKARKQMSHSEANFSTEMAFRSSILVAESPRMGISFGSYRAYRLTPTAGSRNSNGKNSTNGRAFEFSRKPQRSMPVARSVGVQRKGPCLSKPNTGMERMILSSPQPSRQPSRSARKQWQQNLSLIGP